MPTYLLKSKDGKRTAKIRSAVRLTEADLDAAATQEFGSKKTESLLPSYGGDLSADATPEAVNALAAHQNAQITGKKGLTQSSKDVVSAYPEIAGRLKGKISKGLADSTPAPQWGRDLSEGLIHGALDLVDLPGMAIGLGDTLSKIPGNTQAKFEAWNRIIHGDVKPGLSDLQKATHDDPIYQMGPGGVVERGYHGVTTGDYKEVGGALVQGAALAAPFLHGAPEGAPPFDMTRTAESGMPGVEFRPVQPQGPPTDPAILALREQLSKAVTGERPPSPIPDESIPAGVVNEGLRGMVDTNVSPVNVARETMPNPVVEPPVGGARQLADPEQVARGREPSPTDGVTVEAIADRGRQLLDSGQVSPESIKNLNRPPTPDELAAITHMRRQSITRSGEIQNQLPDADPVTRNNLLAEQEAIDRALDHFETVTQQGRGVFHQMGQALQVAFDQDYSLAGLQSKARSYLSDASRKTVDAAMSTVKDLSERVAAAEKAVAQFRQDFDFRAALKNTKRASDPITKLRQVIGEESGSPTGPGFKTKRAGAFQVGSPGDVFTRNVRSVARHYYDTGAISLDEVLANFQRDFPTLSQDQVMRGLSGEYRELALNADVAKIEARQAMSAMRRQAQNRLQGPLQKTGRAVLEVTNALQRAFKLGADVSAPGIQGRTALFAHPKAWLKAWVPQVEGFIHGEPAATRYLADVKSHPLYPAAKAAGLDFTEAGGAFAHQDENFGGQAMKWLDQYYVGKPWTHSEAGFTNFTNAIRWEWFKDVAKIAPKDPAFLKDMAGALNTVSGRGNSAVAKWMGQSPLPGNLATAPRYTVAKWEYNLGHPVFNAKTGLGKAVILDRMYARPVLARVAGVIGIVKLLQSMGQASDFEWDPRSTNFGKLQVGNNIIDIFGSESDPVKLAARYVLGAASEKGNMRNPGQYGFNPGAEYLRGKEGPLLRTADQAATGVLEEKPDGGYQTRPMEGKDLAMGYAPLSITDTIKEGKKGSNMSWLNVFGVNTKAGKLIHPSAPGLLESLEKRRKGEIGPQPPGSKSAGAVPK